MSTAKNNTVPDPSELPPMEQSKLDGILKKHKMYLEGRTGGARCVLQYHNLSNLDFAEHDLSQADFTGSLFIEANLSKGTYVSAW